MREMVGEIYGGIAYQVLCFSAWFREARGTKNFDVEHVVLYTITIILNDLLPLHLHLKPISLMIILLFRDAWSANAGLSRTAAKRRYIDTLIATMCIYASGTNEARELINELEFVWDQVKGNPDVDIASSTQTRNKYSDSLQVEPRGGDGDRLRVLRPMSGPEEEELDDVELPDTYRDRGQGQAGIERSRSRSRLPHATGSWQSRVDLALVQMTAEIAALREVVEARGNRLWRNQAVSAGSRSWIGWFLKGLWSLMWRAATDALILGLVVIALRWRQGGKEKVIEAWRVAFNMVASRSVRLRRRGGRVEAG